MYSTKCVKVNTNIINDLEVNMCRQYSTDNLNVIQDFNTNIYSSANLEIDTAHYMYLEGECV